MKTLLGRKLEETGDPSGPGGSFDARNAGSGHFKLETIGRLCRRNRQGAAAVEFAIVAPLFILFVLGMIEVSRAIMVQQLMTNAAREGARVAVLESTTSTQTVRDKVRNYSPTFQTLTDSQITVNPDPPSTAAAGAPVTVTVSVTYAQVSWLPVPRYFTAALGTDTLTATAVMRRETVQ
jgi:Flp pilus assembly protein TadG